MKQSNVIFATLLFAFIIYITIRGQLPAYLNLFTKKSSETNTANTAGTSSTSSSSHNPIGTALSVFEKFSTMTGVMV